MRQFKVAVYKRNDDGSEGEIVGWTTRFRGQPADAPGAHWAPVELLGLEDTAGVTVDISPSVYFSNYLPAGDYVVAGRLIDRFNRRTYRRTWHLRNWAPPDPQVRDIVPVRLADLDGGSPTFDAPLTGLDPGVGSGGHLLHARRDGHDRPTPNDDALIERREFARDRQSAA